MAAVSDIELAMPLKVLSCCRRSDEARSGQLEEVEWHEIAWHIYLVRIVR